MDVLGALWTRLAYANDDSRYEAHETLLTDITDFYKSSSDVMRESIAALNRMEAELNEFRNDFETPGLILEEQPLDIAIQLLRKSVHRLESGKRRLENIESGGKAQRQDLPVQASIRTLLATLA
jgi:Arc/MetJ-type ribon-helix-helix transcriptional regulator